MSVPEVCRSRSRSTAGSILLPILLLAAALTPTGARAGESSGRRGVRRTPEVVPGEVAAPSASVLLPTVYAAEVNFPRLQSTVDTVCLYGEPGSGEGTFQTVTMAPTFQGWIGVDLTDTGVPPFAGDFAKVFPRVTDLDPNVENSTPVAGFVDDGTPPSNDPVTSTGGSVSPNWVYGVPGGWVVNYTGGVSGGTVPLCNELWSPEIAWDLPGPADDDPDIAGCLLEFVVWRHLPFENGIFYTWRVRSSDDGGATWTPFRSRRNVYYGVGSGDWIRMQVDIGDLFLLDPTHVQIALGVVDLAGDFGLSGNDATPSPFFDNVTLCKYRIGGPAITFRAVDLFQDSFSQSGATDVSTLAARDLLDVRLDAARDGNPGPSITPGDSIVIKVSSLNSLIGISNPATQIRMHWVLDVNPFFEANLRGANPGVLVGGGAANGWDQYRGTVFAQPVTAPPGGTVPDLYFFDLPDADFMYPGDELRFYFEAEDDGNRTTTVPDDLTGFDQGDPWPDTFTAGADPTYSSASGAQPPILIIRDEGGDSGRSYDTAASEEYDFAMKNLGLKEGIHFDSYVVTGADACVGNGIGSYAAHGATSGQLAGYRCIIYDSGNMEQCTLSDGSGTAGNDDADDIATLLGWHDAAFDRYIFYFGDNIASSLDPAFVQGTMGVVLRSSSLSSDVFERTAAAVVVPDPAHPLSSTDVQEEFLVYAGVSPKNTFDDIEPGPVASRLHGFRSPTTPGDLYPAAASVIWDRLQDGHRKVDIAFPYGMAFVWEEVEDRESLSSRTVLLDELLQAFGLVDPSPDTPTGVSTPEPTRLRVEVAPNPFNPRTAVDLHVSRASRVTVRIYDLRGRVVMTLWEGLLPAGRHELRWDGSDAAGERVASGAYLLRVTGPGHTITRKIALLR